MKEVKGDIWSFYDAGEWIAITTNGSRGRDGKAVIGAGIAKQTADRFPLLPAYLGALLLESGNDVAIFERLRIITFPAKHRWHDAADISLVESSAEEVMTVIRLRGIRQVCTVRPRCGNGRLSWYQVRPVLSGLLDDGIVVVSWAGGRKEPESAADLVDRMMGDHYEDIAREMSKGNL